MQSIPGLAHSLLLQTPQFLVLTLFLVMSLVRWSRHPKASALALAGAILLLVDIAASTTFYAWIPQSSYFQSLLPTQTDRFYDAVGLCDNIVNSVGLGLCFLAVFIGRHQFAVAFPIESTPMASRAAPSPPQLPPRQ